MKDLLILTLISILVPSILSFEYLASIQIRQTPVINLQVENKFLLLVVIPFGLIIHCNLGYTPLL